MSFGVTDIPISWNSDNDDLLNVKSYLDGLEEFIRKCPTPISIAIQGDWGTGKTSIMNYLKKKLEQRGTERTVYFNTWQYSQFDMSESLYFSFLSAISSAIDSGLTREFGKKLLNASFIVGKSVISALTGLDRDHLDEVTSTFKKLYDNPSDGMQKFKDLLFASSITATGTTTAAAIKKRSAAQKITCICLNGKSIPVKNIADAFERTYRYFISCSGQPAAHFEQLSAICLPPARHDGYFATAKELDAGGQKLWLGTKSGTSLKYDHVRQLSELLKLPSGSIIWYNGDQIIFSN